MKRLIVIFAVAFLYVTGLSAQDAEAIKERKALARLSESELNSKATKAARKAAKEYEREGWQVAPGALPLEKQLDRMYKMQYEFDDNGFPKYIVGEGMSEGGNYDAAKMQALEFAKQNLAGQISTEVTALVESSVANSQMDAGQVASLAETVSASKNLISQRIGRVITVVDCFRVKSGTKNKEVRVVIAYNSEMALKSAAATVREQLEKKGEKLHADLDKLLGF
ncbi:MAG: hypothetical protein E7117_00950 [Bacteroidales bacterium]|nr:hypothetical protein [Bacteroidales bacterium]